MVRRPSARAAKHAQRARPPLVNPCPPGGHGGQYRPLTAAQVQRIYTEALRILEQIGMADVPPVLLKQAMSKGAKKNALGRLSFPAAMVEDVIAGA